MKVLQYTTDQDSKLKIPNGAQFLSAELHDRGWNLWFLVDPDDPPGPVRYYKTVGTGWECPNSVVHRATERRGAFMWHLLESLFDWNIDTGKRTP
jgi:hypothetical protein